MRANEGLADNVSPLQVLKGALQIPTGNELPAKSDFSVECQALSGVHLFLSMRPNVRVQLPCAECCIA
jgi:hypothetical protein